MVVVHAGVNGCGAARDAAMRGLRALLLDKGDIAAGTTAGSTRLIHGGLRYLEHGEFGLVRESLREREALLRRVAPHLVRPLPMLVPVYAGRRRGRLTIRAGMLAYDLLSSSKSLPRHRMLTAAEALRHAPALEPDGLHGAALFYDAQVEYAERLAVENALDARARGANVLTYARVERLIVEGDAARVGSPATRADGRGTVSGHQRRGRFNRRGGRLCFPRRVGRDARGLPDAEDDGRVEQSGRTRRVGAPRAHRAEVLRMG